MSFFVFLLRPRFEKRILISELLLRSFMKMSSRAPAPSSGVNDVFLIICLTLIAAGISILSILLLWSRNESLHRQMAQMQVSLDRLNEQSSQDWRGRAPLPNAAEDGIAYGEIVQRFEFAKQNKVYRLTHFCQGTVQKGSADGGNIPFCLGKNQLVLSDGIKNTLLVNSMVTSSEQAPVLRKPELLAEDSTKTRIAISYSPDLCDTSNDCGAGMPERYVSHLYTLEDGSLKVLRAFPNSGELFWNKEKTKAIVLPHVCGGAGCTPVALLGYDLGKDQIKELTKAEAAETELAFDVAGKRLPYWKNIGWKNETIVTATVISPDGKSAKVVTTTF